jgi:hypothetical protein
METATLRTWLGRALLIAIVLFLLMLRSLYALIFVLVSLFCFQHVRRARMPPALPLEAEPQGADDARSGCATCTARQNIGLWAVPPQRSTPSVFALVRSKPGIRVPLPQASLGCR